MSYFEVGMIEYVADVAVSNSSLFMSARPFSPLEKPLSDTVNVGEKVRVYLTGYTRKDFILKDKRSLLRSIGNVVHIKYKSTEQTMKIELMQVQDSVNPLEISAYQIMLSMQNSMARGVDFLWYPDVMNYPLSFIACLGGDRIAPRRWEKSNEYIFSFNFIRLDQVQQLSTVPSLI